MRRSKSSKVSVETTKKVIENEDESEQNCEQPYEANGTELVG